MFINAIKINSLGTNGEDYVFHIPAIKYIYENGILSFKKQVTFFTGENGTGKSTILEAIALASGFNAEGGSKNFIFSTNSTESHLYNYLTLIRNQYPRDGFFLRAESFYNVATNVDTLGINLDSYGGKSLHAQSHGESFFSLISNRFHGNGLYILDEPEAALSASRQLALIAEIKRLVDDNSQFLIATHSPILMAYPDADILVLSKRGITMTPYKETDAYLITKNFLDNPERILHYLFESK
ncbi:MAG TPA: ABC transporter ATP-binding protein [Ruminococcaceae bacterium]|jgi:predicted ATPase|nr:ABC transporter ATP-binding protein [Oscillospiraceae bacterium]HCM23689.1 ABC transporter ATP-binding protein [Oscillospiraceae bacterium]